jgi:hypothetical protein
LVNLSTFYSLFGQITIHFQPVNCFKPFGQLTFRPAQPNEPNIDHDGTIHERGRINAML